MYKFFKDKSENFECQIGIEGSSLSKAKARLILENSEYNLIFKGTIDSNGKCIIPVSKLKVLSENLQGDLKLEVIVDDDTYFIPYQDKFEVGINKKITVEVQNKTTNPVILESKKTVTAIVNNKETILENKIVNTIYKIFEARNINLYNIKDNKEVPKIFSKVLNHFKINDKKELNLIQEQLLNKLIKNTK